MPPFQARRRGAPAGPSPPGAHPEARKSARESRRGSAAGARRRPSRCAGRPLASQSASQSVKVGVEGECRWSATAAFGRPCPAPTWTGRASGVGEGSAAAGYRVGLASAMYRGGRRGGQPYARQSRGICCRRRRGHSRGRSCLLLARACESGAETHPVVDGAGRPGASPKM